MIELSKPVAWKFKNADGGDRVSLERKANIYGRHNFQPLYSQEYVSALLADRDAWQASAMALRDELRDELREVLAELAAKDKRIVELEAIRSDASQVFKEIGNELGCNPDNESIMMAIDALKEREKRVVALAGGNADLWETVAARLEDAEAKLATPVRLPFYEFAHPLTERQKGYLSAIIDVKGYLRRDGFTVQGDE